ncbi:MAG TPA: LysE family translocator [Kiloniellales bacterium]|nr:LysE family translocator [Kiloniellales bacterium]
MMVETWLAFTVAAAVLVAVPGPTVMLVIGYALSRGVGAVSWCAAGVALGDFVAMTASLLGVGALLAASATAFSLVKWAGALYLVWLGIRLWRAPAAPVDQEAATQLRGYRIMLHCFTVTALNPKSIVFFVAFLPQFVTPAAPLLPQLAILEATFLTLATLNVLVYALLAARLRKRLRRPRAVKTMNRLGGGVMISAGLLAAALRRSAA